jgi:hypothetical protein
MNRNEKSVKEGQTQVMPAQGTTHGGHPRSLGWYTTSDDDEEKSITIILKLRERILNDAAVQLVMSLLC